MVQSLTDIKSDLTRDNLREDVEDLAAKVGSSLDQARVTVMETVDQAREVVMDTVDDARAPGGVIDVATDTVGDASNRVLAAARQHPVLVVTGVAAVAGGAVWLVARSKRKRSEDDEAAR